MRIFTLTTIVILLTLNVSNSKAQTTEKDYHSYPYWVDLMQDPDANFFETQKAFYEYWKGREMTKGNGYKAFKRWEYWMSRRVSPDGTKPSPDRNIKALQSLGSRSVTTNGNWTSLGPSSVPSGYDGYRGIGRVNAIAFHPSDPNTFYIGSPAGGLWTTTNGGTSWTTTTDNLPTLGVSAIAVDYTNPLIIYIGTGDRDHGDAPGAGVWKSVDGGVTFSASNTGMTSATVSRLALHPIDHNIILAATNYGVYRSTNGGLSWTQTSSGNYKDIVFKPGDPNIVYASASGNFYRSINNGVTFTQITTGLPTSSRGAIAVSPANPEYVYLWLTNSDSFKGLYRSTNSGQSFSVRSTTPNIMSWDCSGGSGGQAWYDLDMACDPTNAEVIYGGGVNCFKSTNGGTTWNINSHWYGGCGVPSVHADLHVLEYNPLNNRLYTGNDGGVYWTSNGGTSWNEISNGLVISQAYKIGQSKTSRNNVINGYQDNGTSTYIGTEWVNVNGGDGMECAFDPTNNSYSYSTIYYGSIYRQIDNNYDGQIAGNGVNGITEDGAWVTPFVIDPADGNTMFVGYDNIWRSNNIKASNTGSVTWTKISNINANDFDVIAQSDANTNILYAANDNALYRSDNVKAGSVTWTNLTSTLPSSNYITSIETSPLDENIVYLVQQNHVYKSTNKGSSWTDITGTLPDVQMNSLVYYHNSNEGLYLGTDIGVFYRDATNPTWINYSTGLPAAAWITELDIYYDAGGAQNDVLRAGTFGRGLWESPLINTSLPAGAGTITGPAIVCQTQSMVTYYVDAIPNATSYSWTLPSGASGSSTTNTILVDFSSNAISGDISVFGSNQFGSGAASSLFVTVNPLPGETGTISGPSEVCSTETAVIYSIDPVINATEYVWTLPAGAVGTSTSNTILVDFTNATTGTIQVFAVNECGAGLSSAMQVIVTPLPGDAGSITGPGTVCQGQSSVVYSVTAISNANSYIWTLPEGASGSSTSNSITVNYSASAASGEITVTGSNECGAGASAALFVTVDALPATAGLISGNQNLCQGTEDVIYSVEPFTGATSYQWTLPPGASGNSNTNSIIADYSVTSSNGNVAVYASNGCGDGLPSSLPVIVKAKPATPFITATGHTITSDAMDGNQWYDQSGSISGAVNQQYIVTWDGDYYTIVTLDECSSDPSNVLTVIVSGVDDTFNAEFVRVYPNPFNQHLTIELKDITAVDRFSLINSSGMIVQQGIINGKASVLTSNLSKGIYLLKLEDQNLLFKIVKE